MSTVRRVCDDWSYELASIMFYISSGGSLPSERSRFNFALTIEQLQSVFEQVAGKDAVGINGFLGERTQRQRDVRWTSSEALLGNDMLPLRLDDFPISTPSWIQSGAAK